MKYYRALVQRRRMKTYKIDKRYKNGIGNFMSVCGWIKEVPSIQGGQLVIHLLSLTTQYKFIELQLGHGSKTIVKFCTYK